MGYELKIRNWWHDHIETLIYVGLWTFLFTTPMLNQYIRMLSDRDEVYNWDDIFVSWKYALLFLLVFVVHDRLLGVLLVKRQRVKQYLLATFLLLVAFTAVQTVAKPLLYEPPQMEQTTLSAAAVDDGARHAVKRVTNQRNELLPEMPGSPIDVVSTMVALLMMGMNLGVKLFFKSERDASELQEAERQNLEAQLAYLRYQVNPHFYMNTLNNIHALVDIDPERAKTTVVELSKMMRYILYDGERNGVSLKREIQFLDNYVRLMRLSYTSSVRIDVEAPETVADRHIPPLVLIIFVENAFKHGISYSEDSFVEVKVAVNGERLVFCCRNSKHHSTETDAKGGVGLVNVRRRLDLLYGDRYALYVDDSDGEYGVRLELPFLENEDF